MKRDMDLIRKTLLAVQDGTRSRSIEGYADENVKYHQALLIGAGFVEGSTIKDSKVKLGSVSNSAYLNGCRKSLDPLYKSNGVLHPPGWQTPPKLPASHH